MCENIDLIKKTAKNTLKHLRNNHPTLTLSELTEALSKGLGFNNFNAIKQAEKNSLRQNSDDQIDDLQLYYPNQLINVILQDKMNKQYYPFNIKELSENFKKAKSNIENVDEMLKSAINNDVYDKWVLPINEKNTSFVISDILDKLSHNEKLRIKQLTYLCGINIIEELKTEEEQKYVHNFFNVLDFLIKNNFNSKYMNYIKIHEKESYVGMNYDSNELLTSLLKIRYCLQQITKENLIITKKTDDIFYYILLFFRLLLNNNMFYASLNEKIIYFILSKESFIRSHEVKIFKIECITKDYRLFLGRNKVELIEKCLNSFFPEIKTLICSKRYYEEEKGIMYYDEEKEFMTIQLNFKN